MLLSTERNAGLVSASGEWYSNFVLFHLFSSFSQENYGRVLSVQGHSIIDIHFFADDEEFLRANIRLEKIFLCVASGKLPETERQPILSLCFVSSV